jgi:hypothetical protein
MQRINVRLFAGWKCVRTLSHIVTGLLTVVFVFP